MDAIGASENFMIACKGCQIVIDETKGKLCRECGVTLTLLYKASYDFHQELMRNGQKSGQEKVYFTREQFYFLNRINDQADGEPFNLHGHTAAIKEDIEWKTTTIR